jgi:aspartate 1-decarboxylase
MRLMLRSKIQRAIVTEAHLADEESIILDPLFMREADISPYEQVHVLDPETGAHTITVAMEGEEGSSEVRVNGAAAWRIDPGDRLVIATYTWIDETEILKHRPRVIDLGERN